MRISGGEKMSDFQRVPRLRLLVFIPPILGFVVSILAGWPGGISPDTRTAINEGIHFSFYGYQEPLFGLAWSIAVALFPVRTAIGIVFILQVFGYWLAFALFAYASLRENSLFMAVLAAVAGFLPPLFDFVGSVESNMQGGIAWTLAIAIAWAFPRRSSLVACLPLIFYGYTARSGMIVAVVPVLFACFLLTAPATHRGRLALYSVVSAATFVLISFMVTQLFLGAPTRESILSVSQLFDIAGIYQKTGTHCVPPSLVPKTTTAEAIMADFDPVQVSSLIWSNRAGGFILPTSETDFTSVRNCWMESIRRHPKEYLQFKAHFARVFLMLGVEWAPATVPDYASNAEFGLSVPHNASTAAIQRFVERSRTSIVWKGWFWLLFSALMCTAALALGAARARAAAMVYVGALCSFVPHFIFGQGALSRYYFLPYILCVSCLLLLGGSLVRSIRGRRIASVVR